MLKTCALFSLCAYVGLAADFVTGQAARLVIGQQTFTDQIPGATDTLLGGVGGVAWAAGTLFVADTNRIGLLPLNNRVLLIPTNTFPQPLDPIPPFLSRCPVCVGQANVVLGQPDFTSTAFSISQSGLRLPTAVASDGRVVAIADTANNRVLIWNSIPVTNNQPANIELGQPDFNTVLTGSSVVVDNRSLRAPQGVWIQNGRLFVADTQNHRVLIWNSIPTQNRQPADLVLGQANFNVAVEPDLTKQTDLTDSNTLLNPVSVTSDGTHLFVTDLGNNRVLIWNSIPAFNQQPADVEIGQKDFQSFLADDSPNLCPSNGTDSNGNLTYPLRCNKTLDFPRFALSDGTRLFIADGGNDRVLVYKTIPTQNAAAADAILGQPDDVSSVITSETDIFDPLLNQSAADVVPSPTSLAWDGTNLYVADPSNRRVLVFTPEAPLIPVNGIRNAASMEIFALGSFTVGGTVTAGDVITLTINGTNYTYTVLSTDSLATISIALANVINAGSGDPNVTATYVPTLQIIELIARQPGEAGNNVTLNVSASDTATITLAASGSTLEGGENTSIVSAGTLIAIFGQNLADQAVSADFSQEMLPLDLGGVELYCDGNRSPLLYVSPTQINGQIPYELYGSNSTSCYVRTVHSDGSVVATTAIGVPLDFQNPGLFAYPGADPRPAIAFHGSSYATGTITVDGSIEAGDVGTISVENRTYSYTVQGTDTLDTVRDALVALVNANPEERVVAYAVGAFHRIQLRAKIAGPEGDGIMFSSTTATNSDGNILLSLSNTAATLCCSNVAGAPITNDNPAIAGETIFLFATGLGLVGPDAARMAIVTGMKYRGPELNDPAEQNPGAFVSSLAGGSTANVISAGLQVGAFSGIYKIVLELGGGTPPSPLTQLTISQDIYTSNAVTIPVIDPFTTTSTATSQAVKSSAVQSRTVISPTQAGSAMANFIMAINSDDPKVTSFKANPSISPAPGAKVTLTCGATGATTIKIGETSITTDSPTLDVFPTVDASYTCVAANAVGLTDSKTLKVEVGSAKEGTKSTPGSRFGAAPVRSDP